MKKCDKKNYKQKQFIKGVGKYAEKTHQMIRYWVHMAGHNLKGIVAIGEILKTLLEKGFLMRGVLIENTESLTYI